MLQQEGAAARTLPEETVGTEETLLPVQQNADATILEHEADKVDQKDQTSGALGPRKEQGSGARVVRKVASGGSSFQNIPPSANGDYSFRLASITPYNTNCVKFTDFSLRAYSYCSLMFKNGIILFTRSLY